MTKIRRLYYTDKRNVKKMISFLGNEITSQFTRVMTNDLFGIIHYALPLGVKFLPESYVLTDKGETLGMITVSPTSGNPYKLQISRLYFEKNYYNVGQQLINFVVSRYGAKGAKSFTVSIDSSHDELMHLFVDGCNFRQCSNQTLWRIQTCNFTNDNSSFFRPFKNSDAKEVAELFNDSLITHYKPYLAREKSEYTEKLFKGLISSCKYRYVQEDKNRNSIIAYCSILTYDNVNYILDITTSQGYDVNYENLMNFAVNQVRKRQKTFNIFVKSKKFAENSEEFENYLSQKGFFPVETQQILVKDFYKLVKDDNFAKPVVFFAESTRHATFKSLNTNID